MTWVDPRTWVTDEIVTSSLLNTHVRDNLRSLTHLTDLSSGDVDVQNTATETTIYSVLIPGGSMGSTGSLVMEMVGDYLHNNAGADTLTARVKFGGVTIIDASTNWNGLVGALRQPWEWQVVVRNESATSAQLVTLRSLAMSMNSPAPTAGIGILAVTEARSHGLLQNTAAIDTTVNQTLLVTAQWSAASTNNSWRRRWARVVTGQN